MNTQKGFIQIPILIAIVVGLIAVGGAGYFGVREYKSRQAEQKTDIGTRDLQNEKPPETVTDPPLQQDVSVKATGAKYKTVSVKPTTGWFKTGQDADIMLSGIDFNNTGGPLLFNHPGNIASDGKRLLLADRNNNRILIWNSLPAGNTPPDIVLGQKNFITNAPGIGLDQLNWPVGLATDGKRVLVADTYNDRILIWNSFPTQNGQAADLEIRDDRNPNRNPKRHIAWPWAVWTNGQKVVVTNTISASVLIWNSFPSQSNQSADIVLYANGNFGTPRSIASDGMHLMIGDHNAKVSGGSGNYFWKTFPVSDDQPYDFFVVADPGQMRESSAPASQNPQPVRPALGSVIWGGMTSDGKLVGITNMISIWNSFPENKDDGPDIQIGGVPGREGYDFGGKQSGDGSGMTVAGGKLYLSLSNGNKVVGFNTLPNSGAQKPDFAIGAPDINTDTLQTNYFITNGVPATDGKSLFVSSDFDRKLYVWKNIPDESGAHPDFVFSVGGWDNALHGTRFAQVNAREVYIWKTLPINGQLPDIIFRGSIGNIELREVKGVAMDDKYFYLSDSSANKIYVWEGLPSAEISPKFTLSVDRPLRLSSDGKHLVVTATLSNQSGHIKVFPIASLSDNAEPIVLKFTNFRTNLPESAFVSSGHLFVADTGFNRVLIWKRIEDAIAGNDPDTILGAKTLQDISPEIGRDKLFWPASIAFDGSFLWVGEFKFGSRLLRYSIGP